MPSPALLLLSTALIAAAAVVLFWPPGGLWWRWRRSLLALLLTIPLWLFLAVSFYFLGRAALIPLSFGPYIFPVVVIALAASIPNPPWNVGMLEILSITTLGVFGVGSSQALAFVVLMRAMRLVPIILGYALFSREGFGLRTQPQVGLEAERPR